MQVRAIAKRKPVDGFGELNDPDPFMVVTARLGDLVNGERTALQFWLLKVGKSLSLLPDDFKAAAGSEVVRKSVEATAKMFIDQR